MVKLRPLSLKQIKGSSYAGNFPFVVLGGLGAMMAVVVVIVLIKSRKTKDITEH